MPVDSSVLEDKGLDRSARPKSLVGYAPVLLAACILVVSLILFHTLRNRETLALKQMVRMTASSLQTQLKIELEARLESLAYQRHRWEAIGAPSRKDWETDATLFAEHAPDLQALEWVDPSLHVRWVAPLKGNEAIIDQLSAPEKRRQEALDAARIQRRPALTGAIDLRQGGRGFLVYEPLYRGKTFEGFLVGVFQAQKLFDTVLANWTARYAISVFDDNGNPLYQLHTDDAKDENAWAEERDLQWHDVSWRVRVVPTAQKVSSDISRTPELLLGSGILVALLVAGLTHFYQRSRSQTERLRDAYKAMQEDLLERNRTEAQLLRMSRAIEQSPVGIVITDPVGRIEYANPKFSITTGYSLQEILGKNVRILKSGKTAPEEYKRLWETITAGREWHGDLCNRAKNGTLHWESTTISPILDKAGRITHFVAVKEDINHRKEAERQIAEALSYNQVLLEASPLGVITFRATGEAVSVNPAAARITGGTLEELAAQNFRSLESWKTSGMLRSAQTALETGEPQRLETNHLSTFGLNIWISCRFVPFQHKAQPHLLVLFADITERKKLEGQLRQVQKMEAIGHLAGGVAHDFNNILAAMLMNLGLMRTIGNLPQEVLDSLDDMEQEAQRATALTRQLLLFSRQQPADFKPLDLSEALHNLLKMLRRLLGETIELRLQEPEESLWVAADLGMMEQVAMNLCINARDAMPGGGFLVIAISAVEFTVEATKARPNVRPGKFVCLSVIDNGCGMDDTVLKRIFEPFFTTKEAGKGTGLGLATVYGIVRQHRGWVEVDSQVGVGSSFRVYLPTLQKPPEVDGKANTPEQMQTGSETILLVEDEPSLRRVTSNCLRGLGYTVLDAGTGAEALTLWDQNRERIRLLFTDMVMPGGLTGLDLAERLGKENAELKCIIASGYNSVWNNENGRPGPEVDAKVTYIAKPYQPATIAKMVRQCLDIRIEDASR